MGFFTFIGSIYKLFTSKKFSNVIESMTLKLMSYLMCYHDLELFSAQVLDSEYVVRLYDVFPQGLGFVLVFEFMISDLSQMISNDDRLLTEPQVISLLFIRFVDSDCFSGFGLFYNNDLVEMYHKV